MEIRINKIKYERKSGNVVIDYDQLYASKDDEVKVVLKSSDKPLPEFIANLDQLGRFVEEICELPEGYCFQAEIRGVSYSWSNEIMGAVITALVPIASANSPVVINTPHLPSASYSEGSEAPILPYECSRILKLLMGEARKYITGDREKSSQMQMSFDEATDEANAMSSNANMP